MPEHSESSRRIAVAGLDAAFVRSYDRLIAWCRRNVRPALGDPEEFVHQAYLRSRRRWSAGRCTSGGEGGYFLRALRWVVTDAIREQTRERVRAAAFRVTRPAWRADGPRELDAREVFERTLTPRERAVCEGFLLGHTEQQLSDRLGIRPETLAVHACRAKQKLRRELGVSTRQAPGGFHRE